MSVAAATSTGTLRRRLTARLAAAFAGTARAGTAALDARLLLAHALGVDAAGLALHDEAPLDAAAEARALAYVERRIAGEPVARIVGHREFWSLDLVVGPETLVPRPDTETVVEAALAFVDRADRRDAPLHLLDIGTGSGAILLALLSELPRATGIGTDRAEGALAVARENARRLGLAGRAAFVASDWASAIGGGFDLVLANPPYVESAEIARLEVEVAAHDPHIALDGGADGLDACRAILADLDRLLAARGRGFLEVGLGQASEVARLAEIKGFAYDFRCDLAGFERVVELRRGTEDQSGEGEEGAD